MNTYRFTISMAGGPRITVEKQGRTERCARQALYAQIGNSYRITIHAVEKVEA